MSRRWVLGFVAVVAVVVVLVVAAIVRSPDDEVVDLRLFDYPGTVCERNEADSFEAQVSELASTPGRELRLRLTQVRADLVRKFVERRSTPIEARASVVQLADALDRTARADDSTTRCAGLERSTPGWRRVARDRARSGLGQVFLRRT